MAEAKSVQTGGAKAQRRCRGAGLVCPIGYGRNGQAPFGRVNQVQLWGCVAKLRRYLAFSWEEGGVAMAEYVGTDNQIDIQRKMRQRQSWIAETPGVANGGRVLAFDDPDRVGWGTVLKLAQADNLVVFPQFPEEEIVAKIRRFLGAHWKTPVWLLYVGEPERVLSASLAIIEAYDLPRGWRVEANETPNDQQIDAVQSLNMATGIAPYPAFFSRGEAGPIVTVCLYDEAGVLVATAAAVMRYHRASRLGGSVFAGMVSVTAAQRGKGLGKLVNAVVLAESQKRLSWHRVMEQAAHDNAASQAMIAACGLERDENNVTVAAIDMDETFTR